MARQKGTIKIEGTIHDMTFYKMGAHHFVRAKRKVSRSRILTDPKFVRVRENASEFGSAVKSGKLLRDAVINLFKEARNRTIAARVLQVMLVIVKLDTVSDRGKRNVGIALASAGSKKLLKGFEFNSRAAIGTILLKPYVVNTETGVISIPDLISNKDVTFPEGATHLTFRSAYANVNFTEGLIAIEYTNELNLLIDATPTDVTLTPRAIPDGTGTKLYFLQIEFFQLVNGIQYALANGSYNGLVIAEVG